MSRTDRGRPTFVETAIAAAVLDAEEQGRTIYVRWAGNDSATLAIGPTRGPEEYLVCSVSPNGAVNMQYPAGGKPASPKQETA